MERAFLSQVELRERWTQAVVRSYVVKALLTVDGVRALNDGDSPGVFKIARWEDREDECGPYTLLDVYVKDEADFVRVEEGMRKLEADIEMCLRQRRVEEWFGESIQEVATKEGG